MFYPKFTRKVPGLESVVCHFLQFRKFSCRPGSTGGAGGGGGGSRSTGGSSGGSWRIGTSGGSTSWSVSGGREKQADNQTGTDDKIAQDGNVNLANKGTAENK